MIKFVFGVLMLVTFSSFSYAGESSDGLDVGSLTMMAKAFCEGKINTESEQKRRAFCSQYHAMMSSYHGSIQVTHEACAKQPDMEMCQKIRRDE